jgi:hypothetical protein
MRDLRVLRRLREDALRLALRVAMACSIYAYEILYMPNRDINERLVACRVYALCRSSGYGYPLYVYHRNG